MVPMKLHCPRKILLQLKVLHFGERSFSFARLLPDYDSLNSFNITKYIYDKVTSSSFVDIFYKLQNVLAVKLN